MAYPTVLYGPESEVFNTYAVVSPAPGNNGSGGAIAYRHVLPLGKQLVLEDGRKFRFAGVGGSTLVIGNVLSSGVATASQQALAPAAAAINDRTISLTTGASTAVNVFAEGWANVSITPGLGNSYKIASHALMTSGAGDIVNLAPGHAIRVALTTSSRIDLIDNPYFRVIQLPATTAASCIVGVALVATLTLRGNWIQTHGPACVLGITGLIAGTRAIAPSSTAGAVGPEVATGAEQITTDIGNTMFAVASTSGQNIDLTLDG
jgi:hypothetical protein